MPKGVYSRDPMGSKLEFCSVVGEGFDKKVEKLLNRGWRIFGHGYGEGKHWAHLVRDKDDRLGAYIKEE